MRLTTTEFADRAALATGGTRGIGVVRRLACEGAGAALTYFTSADRALVQSPQFKEKSWSLG
jgi:NAD(P)-dependent dehydrogenase (short-subunit alcohol dehydrogenase family)